MATVN